MLKLAGEGIRQEKFEAINYTPGIQDSTDLEAATHTIVPTARPAIGAAQYSKSLTLPAPSSALLTVLRICTRLNVNITSLGTATHVYSSVRVDVDDTDHELFNTDWTSIASKLSVVDVHAGNKPTIFNSLKNGSAHIFYFLFWADVANQAQIDIVQLWEAIGGKEESWGAIGHTAILSITHTGFAFISPEIQRQGTGTPSLNATASATKDLSDEILYSISGMYASPKEKGLVLCKDAVYLWVIGGVATDLNYLHRITCILRSEQ